MQWNKTESAVKARMILFRLATSLFVIMPALGSQNDISYKEYNLTTKVDHFTFRDNRTYQLRYAIADQFWDRKGGPVFFYTGNEDPYETFIKETGVIWEWAPDFKALIVFAEHRFYGKSLPFGDESYQSPKNLGYLTSEQALADYAYLVVYLKTTLAGAAKSQFVAFGGSYGGMLAAWFRIKYPHLIAAALASSAPLRIFPGLTPCGAFSAAVTESYARESEACSSAIRKSWNVLQRIASTDDGARKLQEKFRICQSIGSSNYTRLRNWIRETYEVIALVNYGDADTFLKALPGHPVKEACRFFKNVGSSETELVDAVSKVTNLFFNYTGKTDCNDVTIYETGDPGWIYQGCTELINPVCRNGKDDMFYPETWNLTLKIEQCEEMFGVTPDATTGFTMYGGSDLPTANNIIFSNGDLDPWKVYAVPKPPTSDSVVLLIQNAAHYADLRFSAPTDSPSLKAARQTEKYYIRKWISAH